jgi:hypothetical protein
MAALPLLFISTESKEVYKRQVLSITCITVGISVLGILCMALYCRNKWVDTSTHRVGFQFTHLNP